MKRTIRTVLTSVCAVGLLAGVVSTPALSQQPIKLLFASISSETGFLSDGVKAFAKDLESKTNGRVKVELSWSEGLGKMTEYYDLTVRGMCDAGAFNPVQSAKGQFPLAEISTLSFNLPTAEIATKAFFEVYRNGHMDKGLDQDVKPLFFVVDAGNPIFTVKKPVTTLAEFKGMKMKMSGGESGPRLTASGATPVFLAGGETYLALQKGIVDGQSVGYAPLRQFKWCEVQSYVTEPNIMGSVTLGLFMNRNAYNKLPKDVQKVIDEMAQNNAYGLIAAKQFDAMGAAGKECFLKRGGKVVQWEQAALNEMQTRLAPQWAKWIADREAKKLPVRKTIEEFYMALKKLGVENPAIGYAPGK